MVWTEPAETLLPVRQEQGEYAKCEVKDDPDCPERQLLGAD
jgi:hypothetical protein